MFYSIEQVNAFYVSVYPSATELDTKHFSKQLGIQASLKSGRLMLSSHSGENTVPVDMGGLS